MVVHIINSFTTNGKGGNPAGIVIDFDRHLSDFQMQAIAKKMALSETAFIRRGNQGAAFDIRFFTPTEEVDLCGHATIASFWFLSMKGLLTDSRSSQMTKAGLLPVEILTEASGELLIMMAQSSPEQIPLHHDIRIDLLEAFPGVMLSDRLPLEIWSTGLKDLLVPVTTRHALNQLHVDFDRLSALSETLDVVGAHVFALDDGRVFARNFAPRFGIDEESATGTSNGALTAYLNHHVIKSEGDLTLEILQGESMGATSKIITQLRQDCAEPSIWVGGYCTYVKEVVIEL